MRRPVRSRRPACVVMRDTGRISRYRRGIRACSSCQMPGRLGSRCMSEREDVSREQSANEREHNKEFQWPRRDGDEEHRGNERDAHEHHLGAEHHSAWRPFDRGWIGQVCNHGVHGHGSSSPEMVDMVDTDRACSLARDVTRDRHTARSTWLRASRGVGRMGLAARTRRRSRTSRSRDDRARRRRRRSEPACGSRA